MNYTKFLLGLVFLCFSTLSFGQTKPQQLDPCEDADGNPVIGCTIMSTLDGKYEEFMLDSIFCIGNDQHQIYLPVQNVSIASYTKVISGGCTGSSVEAISDFKVVGDSILLVQGTDTLGFLVAELASKLGLVIATDTILVAGEQLLQTCILSGVNVLSCDSNLIQNIAPNFRDSLKNYGCLDGQELVWRDALNDFVCEYDTICKPSYAQIDTCNFANILTTYAGSNIISTDTTIQCFCNCNLTSSDLAVVKTENLVNDTANASGGFIYTLTATNTSGLDEPNAVVTDILPTGINYVADDQGTYNPATGVWTVGALTNGQSKVLNITVATDFTNSSFSVSNTATITGDNPDASIINNTSTVGNTVIACNEDDLTVVSATGVLGTGGGLIIATNGGNASALGDSTYFAWDATLSNGLVIRIEGTKCFPFIPALNSFLTNYNEANHVTTNNGCGNTTLNNDITITLPVTTSCFELGMFDLDNSAGELISSITPSAQSYINVSGTAILNGSGDTLSPTGDNANGNLKWTNPVTTISFTQERSGVGAAIQIKNFKICCN